MNNTSSINNDANLKIPTMLIIKHSLSSVSLLVYGELNGLYSKHKQCFITDKTLSQRLNRSTRSVQRAMYELKSAGLISSKQKPNHKGRRIIVSRLNAKKFLLIPVVVARDKDLSTGAILLYGSLYSREKKLIKVNTDKHQEDASLIISATKSEIAQELKKGARTIRYQLKELEDKKYIKLISNKGINVEIMLIPLRMKPILDGSDKKHIHTAIKLWQKVRSTYGKTDGYTFMNLCKKCRTTYAKNVVQPMQKVSYHLCKKCPTNRTLININKDDYSSSFNKDQRGAVDPFDPFEVGEPLKEPVYYDSIPNDDEMPPKTNNDETSKDIAELNTLDIQNATQHKTSPITGKSGSESGNKYIDRSTKPTRKKYHAYNGFNLDYQVDQLRKMLNSKTGKHYPITNQRPLIEQRLKDGFTLYDFEKAIDYLIQQRRTISIRELVINISTYLNKINSN